MKLVCAQSTLSSNLSLVSRAVSSRPSHPVLANVLVAADAKAQRVSLSAFDLSLGIQTSFAAQVESGGTLTLPAKLLSDIVSRLPDGEISLDADLDGEVDASPLTTLTCASGRYQVRGMGAEAFPELPSVEDGDVVHLSVDSLIEGLRGSLFAASADETKQVLTGIHVSLSADGLEFAATDGHRLAVVQTLNEEDAESAKPKSDDVIALNVTIPAKALRELERMLDAKQSGSTVALHIDHSQVIFEWAEQQLTSRLLEGQYPNYRQLVPRQFTRQMTIERRLFLATLERIAVLADQKNNIVKLTMDSASQKVTLSVDAQDVGSGKETIPAQISGEDLDVAFNVRYLMDGLKVLNTTEVQMQLNTPTSPVILTPLGGTKMTYLVMPVQVRS